MSGRGDNNKQGSSGRGANRQSLQAFPDDAVRERKPSNRKTYDLLVDDVPYSVITEPFTFNGEQRYYISVNGGPEHVFTWDSEIKRLTAIDDEGSILPDALEQEISRRLEADL
ncbi:hypothetical protein [Longitalea arenae]|uniref:hypothetical protein n=1 Tax=Longitalea arenae TaxID=2812558 RepID=UPI001F073CA6|nr:hypothetical protein [Longitalea arenae]